MNQFYFTLVIVLIAALFIVGYFYLLNKMLLENEETILVFVSNIEITIENSELITPATIYLLKNKLVIRPFGEYKLSSAFSTGFYPLVIFFNKDLFNTEKDSYLFKKYLKTTVQITEGTDFNKINIFSKRGEASYCEIIKLNFTSRKNPQTQYSVRFVNNNENVLRLKNILLEQKDVK